MRFTFAALVPFLLTLVLYSRVPASGPGSEQAGPLAFGVFLTFYAAAPFIAVYWCARIVRRVFRRERVPVR